MLLCILTAQSGIRRVGDGSEYLDMAQDLLRIDAPSLHVHFWFYPALAVPFLALVRLTPLDPFAAFVPLNLVLLGSAFWIASGVLRWPALLMIFVGPIVWWVDKAHTEVFTFSLLTIALIALRPARAGTPSLHPGWAVVCLAAAGTQNPPFLLLAPLAAAWLAATKTAAFSDRRFVAFCAAGLLLAALHPAYYYLMSGQPTGLTRATHGGIPNIDEVTAVIRDTNIGIVANAPAFAIAWALVVGALVVRSPRVLPGADTWFAMGAGALFLASFSLTTNYEHGGTPGMSRYAIWLIPLVVPFLRRAGEARLPVAVERSVAALAAVSCVWSILAFHPGWPQYGPRSPSRLASWLWKNHPSLDRPLPEVFVERLQGPLSRRLPATSPDCTKILLIGQGGNDAIWPVPCFPVPVPPECRARGALCYANRSGSGYAFSRVPEPSRATFRFDRDSVWTREESATVGALLVQVRWWEMAVCDVSVNRITRGQFGLGGPRHYCASDRLLAYFKNGEGAYIRMRLRTPMSGVLLDASTGQLVSRVAYDRKPGELWDLTIPAGPSSVVLILTETGWAPEM